MSRSVRLGRIRPRAAKNWTGSLRSINYLPIALADQPRLVGSPSIAIKLGVKAATIA